MATTDEEDTVADDANLSADLSADLPPAPAPPAKIVMPIKGSQYPCQFTREDGTINTLSCPDVVFKDNSPTWTFNGLVLVDIVKKWINADVMNEAYLDNGLAGSLHQTYAYQWGMDDDWFQFHRSNPGSKTVLKYVVSSLV